MYSSNRMINKAIYIIKLAFIPCEENEYRPKLLEGRFLIYCAILLLVFKIFILSFFVYFPSNIFFADITKAALISLTSKQRESLGVQTLKENSKLAEAALLKAENMMKEDYFSHQSPEGISPWYWFKEAGYNYKFAGENLAIGFLDSEELNTAWLDSPSHRRNLLDPNYTETGIAVLTGDFQGGETTIVVQLFGNPQKQTAEVRPSETAAAKKIIVEAPKEERAATQTAAVSINPESTSSNRSKEVLAAFQEPKKQNGFTFNILSFISSEYYNLLQKIIYGFLAFITALLIITTLFDIFVYKAYEIQYKDIFLETCCFCLFLTVLLLIDKEIIIKMIPHDFRIY